jgi:hypothetical protein
MGKKARKKARAAKRITRLAALPLKIVEQSQRVSKGRAK